MAGLALGPLCAFAASLTWVIGSSVYAHLSKRYAAAAVNYNRALVALPLFTLASLMQADEVRASLTALGPEGVVARAGWLAISITGSYALGDMCFLWATLSLGYPAAQAIGATYPLWAALAGMTAGEPLSGRKAVGVLVVIAGTITVVLSGRGTARVPPKLAFLRSYGTGVVFALLTSLFWAINSFATSRGGAGMNAAFANVIRMSLALALCPALVRVTAGRGARLLFDRRDYLRLLPFFAIEAFLGSYLYMYGLSHSPIAVGATLSSLAPVASVPVAVALGWERFSFVAAGAVALVVLGVVLLVG